MRKWSKIPEQRDQILTRNFGLTATQEPKIHPSKAMGRGRESKSQSKLIVSNLDLSLKFFLRKAKKS